jgi:hypothetical protein
MVMRRLNDHVSQRKEPVHVSLDGNSWNRRIIDQPHLYLPKHADDHLLASPEMLYAGENRVQAQLAVKSINKKPMRVGSVR